MKAKMKFSEVLKKWFKLNCPTYKLLTSIICINFTSQLKKKTVKL